jgi:hypothetical protein
MFGRAMHAMPDKLAIFELGRCLGKRSDHFSTGEIASNQRALSGGSDSAIALFRIPTKKKTTQCH